MINLFTQGVLRLTFNKDLSLHTVLLSPGHHRLSARALLCLSSAQKPLQAEGGTGTAHSPSALGSCPKGKHKSGVSGNNLPGGEVSARPDLVVG